MSASSFGLGGAGHLSSRQPEYQNQYTLVNTEGRLRFAAVPRHTFELPPEILADIFLHCLPEAPGSMFPSFHESYESMLPSLTTAPLVFCGVCRRWRGVAITTSALWSSLFIDFDKMSKKGVHRRGMVEMYLTWLSRARSAPLSLILRQEKELQGEDKELLIRSIVELSGQWRSLELDAGQDVASLMFCTARTYTLLEDLNISSPDGLAISIFHAPKLREVLMTIDNPRIQLPWHQLTSLCCYGTSISSWLEILRQSPNLLEVKFQIEADREPFTLPSSVLQLDCLRSLSLSVF
ncbi:hypothetical protein DFH06DRAFT_49354 [Mycena polygramma]|nr:hypothetical protein DFH06DRAFT_49354 [Mycena polygramma]